MRSHKTLIGPAASLLLLVACTTAVQGEPPDVFAPTPSIAEPTTTVRRTVTTVDRETHAMYRVDPLLNRLSGYQPLAMGDYSWEWARSSSERWLLVEAASETGVSELRLIDLLSWSVSGTFPLPNRFSGAQVSDSGVVYLIGSYDDPVQMAIWEPEMTDPQPITDLPSDYVSWNQPHLTEDVIHILGFQQDPGSQLAGEVALISVDTDGSGLRSIPLPQVPMGVVGEVDVGQPWPGTLFMSPAVIWDDSGSRALIVNADRETITEVDLVSGQVGEHVYGDDDRASGQISAALSPSGSLYIASSDSVYTTTDDAWAVDTNAEGLVVVDTASWKTVRRLDLPISSIALSPDGTRLLASGYTDHQSENDYVTTSTGSYLIDADSLDIIAQLEPAGENGPTGTMTFDKFSQVGYMTEYGGMTQRIDVIALDTGEIVSFREGDNIQVLGGLGVLGDRSDG